MEREETPEEKRERAALERELAELDTELKEVEAKEVAQMAEVERFESYRETIEKDEQAFWSEFNSFEQ